LRISAVRFQSIVLLMDRSRSPHVARDPPEPFDGGDDFGTGVLGLQLGEVSFRVV
jgi:hypothetical protein